VFFFALNRFLRHDVKTIFADAPLCVGFEGWLSVASGYAAELAGSYRLCLVNTIGEMVGVKPLDVVVNVADGIVTSVEHRDVTEAVVAQVNDSIEARHASEPAL